MKMKKLLAIGIIFLFIGVAVAPSINTIVVKASNDNDLVAVTSQACGIRGFGNTTVRFTRQQYENLEKYFVDYRARLNQTSSREEVISIFKDAICELNKYGLLPKGMNIQQAQRIVTPGIKESRLLNRIASLNSSDVSGFFCLVSGRASRVYITNIITPGISSIVHFILSHISPYTGTPGLWAAEGIITFLFVQRNHFSSPGIFSLMAFGGTSQGSYFPSTGWIFSSGLLRKQNYSGDFYGYIPYRTFIGGGIFYYEAALFTGLFGFTGLKIFDGDTSTFIGTALRVYLGSGNLGEEQWK
jgi:hypothetical protein